MPILPGTRFGRYEIRAPLGAGAMGEVYLAQDVQLGRKVALKLLPADLMQNIDRLRRFEQEARAASALNHPNILTISEVYLEVNPVWDNLRSDPRYEEVLRRIGLKQRKSYG